MGQIAWCVLVSQAAANEMLSWCVYLPLFIADCVFAWAVLLNLIGVTQSQGYLLLLSPIPATSVDMVVGWQSAAFAI